jgi:hypothetical protein
MGMLFSKNEKDVSVFLDTDISVTKYVDTFVSR